ncbi:MAG: nucleotidyltransferase [Acidobacteriota bacterium]|nr:nucleotidyltransferase [Acidobacteriota bacterium]
MPQPDDSPEVPVTTSTPVEIPQEQHAMFRKVLGVLEENKVPFAVAGAFALQEHTGICRWTKDLDIFLTAANTPLALNSLRDQGFECEITDPVWLAKAWRDDFFVDLITGMSNAVIVVEDSWIERANPAIIHEVKTRVLAPEELLASKLFVIRRERFDGADIAHVIYGTRGKLDWTRIMSLVGEHWEMLLWELVLYRYVYPAHSHYVPADIWRTLLERFQSAISTPAPDAEFRGSLVDDNMFAIDVNDWGMPNVLERYRKRRLREIAEFGKKQAVQH